MVYDVYISKLREISNYENPRQVYLDKDFSKTTLYRVLSNEVRKNISGQLKRNLYINILVILLKHITYKGTLLVETYMQSVRYSIIMILV